MELESLTIKDNAKKIVNEESPLIEAVSKEVPHNNFARTYVPNVFEHQYAEYISGLKPPYMSLEHPSEKRKHRQIE